MTGICKGLRADWNDCLNLAGGESAMVSFMHHWALRAFVEAAQFLGRSTDVAKYSAMADKVTEALWTPAGALQFARRLYSYKSRDPE